MSYQPDQSGRATAGDSRIVSVWLYSSAFLGFVIGLIEAFVLWTTPRSIPLLVPDVGWVIWFLAPLVDMTCFGLSGLLLGLLAKQGVRKEVLISVQAGSAITFAITAIACFHLEGSGLLLQSGTICYPLAIFALGTGISLLVIVRAYDWLSLQLVGKVGFVTKSAAGWALATITVVTVLGISIFTLRPTLLDKPALAASPAVSGAPNIVFITLDTVRADHLSSYGYSRPTTPNIDRFARTGVLFENAIAPTSWTLASHASMFTGLLPQQHGADWAVPLASNPWTLAEILRSNGYKTAGLVANLLYLQRGWGIAQGFGHYEDASDSLKHNFAVTHFGSFVLEPAYRKFYRFDYFDRENGRQLNERVFRWFRHRPQGPFFVFINYFDTHEPYLTSPPYDHRFGHVSMDLVRRIHMEISRHAELMKLNARDQKHLIDAYDNCLAYLDDQVGNLLKFLRQSPNWRNTIVIITSDHGEEFGMQQSYEHGQNLYRGVLHVPLIISGPGVPQGVRISHLVGTRQLFSTVLDMAGRGHTPFSRTSLARFWDPNFKPGPFDNAVVSELIPEKDLSGQRAMASLTTPQWQYIEHRDGRQELYNWVADPKEKGNLVASSQDLPVAESLRSRLIKLVSDATGPWHGMPYLQALDTVTGPARLSLLHPQPFQPGAADNRFRIGIAQAYFKPDESISTRPSRSEREVMQSLSYQ